MLAEAVHLSDGAATVLVLLFVAVLALLAVAAVLAVVGCVLAYRAGRGSRMALGAWIAVGSIFGLVWLRALTDLPDAGPSDIDLIAAGVLAVQGALYGLGRAIGRRALTPAAGAPPEDREVPAGPGRAGGTG